MDEKTSLFDEIRAAKQAAAPERAHAHDRQKRVLDAAADFAVRVLSGAPGSYSPAELDAATRIAGLL